MSNGDTSIKTVLSVVIIEYHCADDVLNCISYFRQHSGIELCEFIVSSNSSYSPDMQEELRKKSPGILWIFNARNGGFAYGMNRGLEIARGEFLLICNPDVRLKNKLSPALYFLREHPRIGALGARIEDSKGNIQDSCRKFMWPGEMIKRQILRLFTSRDVLLNYMFDYSQTQIVDWIIGAFILIRREVYQKTAGLDEKYFLYVEDMDWCYRIHLAGYEICYFPEVKIEYKGDRKSTSAIFRSKKLINAYGIKHLKSYCRFLRKFYFSEPK